MPPLSLCPPVSLSLSVSLTHSLAFFFVGTFSARGSCVVLGTEEIHQTVSVNLGLRRSMGCTVIRSSNPHSRLESDFVNNPKSNNPSRQYRRDTLSAGGLPGGLHGLPGVLPYPWGGSCGQGNGFSAHFGKGSIPLKPAALNRRIHVWIHAHDFVDLFYYQPSHPYRRSKSLIFRPLVCTTGRRIPESSSINPEN